MINRNLVECDNCKAITLLRIGVGGGDEIPFRYDCGECSQELTGALLIDQQAVRILGLRVEGGTVRYEGQHQHTVLHHPDFLVPENRPSGTASPFMEAFARLGGADLQREATRAQKFVLVAQNDRKPIERLIKNYKKTNWKMFDRGVAEYLPYEVGPPREERTSRLFTLLDLMLEGVVASNSNGDLLSFFKTYVGDLDQPATRPALDSLLLDLRGSKIVKRTITDALSLIPRFLALAEELAPVLTDWDPESPDRVLPEGLNVQCLTGFDKIKSLYSDAYEMNCRGLTILTGLLNLTHRGDHNAYPPDPAAKKKNPKPLSPNLLKFHGGPHGSKLPLLLEEPRFHSWLSFTLDSKLRNSIGHYAIEYEPDTGLVSYVVSKDGLTRKSITYANFLLYVTRAIARAYQLAHLAKILDEV